MNNIDNIEIDSNKCTKCPKCNTSSYYIIQWEYDFIFGRKYTVKDDIEDIKRTYLLCKCGKSQI
jgi:hypothetical protein